MDGDADFDRGRKRKKRSDGMRATGMEQGEREFKLQPESHRVH